MAEHELSARPSFGSFYERNMQDRIITLQEKFDAENTSYASMLRLEAELRDARSQLQNDLYHSDEASKVVKGMRLKLNSLRELVKETLPHLPPALRQRALQCIKEIEADKALFFNSVSTGDYSVDSDELIRNDCNASNDSCQTVLEKTGSDETLRPSSDNSQVSEDTFNATLARSFSADDVVMQAKPMIRRSTISLRPSSLMRRALSPWTNGRSLKYRQHDFANCGRVFWFTTCDFCKDPIHFGSRRNSCKDCKQVTHIKCSLRLAVPCVPSPTRPVGSLHQKVSLQKLCPETPPRIPYPILLCVLWIEKRNLLTYCGLYRVPGAPNESLSLFEHFRKQRAMPNLDEYSVEAMTDCIKITLEELKDPLIPTSSRHEFLDAAKKGDDEKLTQAIIDLPIPHRDTLAFLCLHWIRVCAHSDVNKMRIEHISKAMAQIVFGISVSKLTDAGSFEATRHEKVLVALLQKPLCEWQAILDLSVGTGRASPSSVQL